MPACLQRPSCWRAVPRSPEHWPAWGQEVAPPVPLSSGGLLSEVGPRSSVMNVMVIPTCLELEDFLIVLSNV